LVRNCTNLGGPAKIKMVFRVATPIGFVKIFDQLHMFVSQWFCRGRDETRIVASAEDL